MKTTAEDSSEEAPSTHVVLSNHDLLIEILLRLPVVSLHVFKSVSKRWLSIITNPNFTLRHSPFGLFLPRQSFSEYDFVQLYNIIPANRSPLPTTFTLKFDSHKAEILHSCNGLLLCRVRPDKLYVYNPSIYRFKAVEVIPECRVMGSFKMAFDPSKSSHYKIVYAGVVSGSVQIGTYSSETCEWKICKDQFPLQRFRGFHQGIYWNDAIHWLHNANRALHCRLDVEHKCLTSINTPKILDGKEVHCDQRLFESHGCLLLLCIDLQRMSIYEMREGDSGWSVKYIVNLVEFMMLLPKTWRKGLRCLCSNHVRCIMIGKREEDSFLVMEIYGKIVQYKIALKTLRKLYELESFHSPVSFQFIASVAGV
ncbi:F-box protein At5g07610 [Helianthus annuus]|nr:F-box protein At5g07610 [Helianthus annuus]